MENESLFIGRQPILDLDGRIFGYELLFRDADTLSANVTDSFQASANVLLNTLSTFGIQGLLGKHKGFVNVSSDLLMSETLELLPREQVVIELLETIQVNKGVVERCRILKEMGFSLALDDHRYDPSYGPLYELVDIVKLDILDLSPAELLETVAKLKGGRLRLLAEKVETNEQMVKCRKLGFQLFQGYYFALPMVLHQRRMDMARIALMQLLQLINSDAETLEIEGAFKDNPTLTYNLLRLVNSVAMGFREKIGSVRHAIVVLGRSQLKRWIVLALFASSDERGFSSPLLEMAAMRGRLMELLVRDIRGAEYAEMAFMTGILSLIDTILEVAMAEATRQLNLVEDIRDALLSREGVLGELLSMIEKLEHADFSGVMPLLHKNGLLAADLHKAQLQAVRWTNSLSEMEQPEGEAHPLPEYEELRYIP